MTMNRRQRGALADATLAAGATVLLLVSTSAATGRFALALGILLVLVGIALLWGTPKPILGTRLLASVSGLLVGFGAITPGAGRWVALGTGVVLLAAVFRVAGRGIVARRPRP